MILERLGNTELYLDKAKASMARAEDKTEELRKLNRSIFIPAVTFNNDAKHAARDAKVQRRHEEKRAEREKTMLGRSEGWGGREETVPSGSRGIRSTTQRSRFQFDANASDDDMEDALEGNLDEIQGLVGNLKPRGEDWEIRREVAYRHSKAPQGRRKLALRTEGGWAGGRCSTL